MKNVFRFLVTLALVVVLMPIVAGAAESDGRIILSEGSDNQYAVWVSPPNENGESDVLFGNSLDEEGYHLLMGPVRSVEIIRSNENGFAALMEADDNGPIIVLQGNNHSLELHYNLKNLREYSPGKLCALAHHPSDKSPLFWFEPLDNDKWCGGIDFGPVDTVFFHEDVNGRSFFYAVDNKNNLMIEKPEIKTSNSIIKAKKIATIQQGTKPVDGGTYVGFFTDKGEPGYTIGGEKPTIFKKHGSHSFYFFEGFMLMYDAGLGLGGRIVYPENPLPVSEDAVDEIFWSVQRLDPREN